MSKYSQKGFTIVELLISSAFFGFILLFILTAFLQVNQSYNKGITTKRVQESARIVIEELSRFVSSAQRSSTNATVSIRTDRVCIDGVRYVWNTGFREDPPLASTKTLSDGRAFTIVRLVDGHNCDDITNYGGSAANATELIDDRLAIQDISITSPISSVYTILVTISANNDPSEADPLISGSGSSVKCNVVSGDQYCDIAQLQTTVTLRN